MTDSSSKKKSGSTAHGRALRLVGVVFLAGWILTLGLLLLMHGSWRDIVGSIILFGGFTIAWAITIFRLKKKGRKYVELLLHEEDEKPDKAKIC